jgi:hypothetical protein
LMICLAMCDSPWVTAVKTTMERIVKKLHSSEKYFMAIC